MTDEDVDIDVPSYGSELELDDGQLAYDCTTWAGESRGLLASLLTSTGIAHAWQGTVLTVREADEEAVDELIDDVMASARPALDPEAVKLVYEVSSWPVALQTELTDALTGSDVAYEWNEAGDIVVSQADEDAVEAVLDELDDPEDAAISADDGVALHELLDSLFMAADRLTKHPGDPGSTVSMVDDAAVVGEVALPFGFEAAQWRRLVESAAHLAEALDGSAVDDAEVAGRARSLRDLLRQYV